ncbi:hypothetical protein FQN49_000553 [Arthroderma sp. PD_2]|nr:hypothetical protein FQN49_000553 [Arthroderma sp. PD_2]
MADVKLEQGVSAVVLQPIRAITSKTAQQSYINLLLFTCTSFALFGISSISYWVFYYNYVPQISLERQIHLQYDTSSPYGTATIGSQLIPLQKYDVKVILQLPYTPANRAAGNFMLDLAFLQEPDDLSGSIANVSENVLLRSRRPAMLTYTSPMVDTARQLWRLPLYVLGLKREAEELKIGMMERVQFPRGKGMVPRGLRLEIQSRERIQVYKASVRIDARFTGLRWVMYNWRTLSFLTFGSMFWMFSMTVAAGVWALLSSRSTQEEGTRKAIKEEEDIDSDDEPKGPLEQTSDAQRRVVSRITPEIKVEEEDEPSAYGSNEDEGAEEDQASESSDLVVNDDGPPSSQSSPYVHSLVHTLQSSGHVVSVVLPHRQRSWIGKAHLVGATVKPTYFHPGTLFQDDGTVHALPRKEERKSSEGDEWVLIDSTPASCVQIGLFHYFQDRGPVDLVISGPNYGRNSTAVFSLSSGTIGGAMEAAVCGYKSIALSFAFSSRDHDPVVISEAANHSVRLIEYIHKNWTDGVDLYSINVPLEPGVGSAKILYTNILDNRWSGSCFEAIDAEMSGEDPGLQEYLLRQKEEGSATNGEASDSSTPGFQHKHFKWAPKFGDVYKSEQTSPPGNDGWAVRSGFTSVTPLKANFMHWPGCSGEITLLKETPIFYALVDCQDAYVQPLVMGALQRQFKNTSYRLISSLSELPDPSSPLLQYRVYEQSDFEHVHTHPSTSLVNSYIIRKALIRKHFLSNTVANWITKYPDSLLQKHFKPTIDFELDYAEFLDEALLEAYELRESLDANEEKKDCDKEWWILKPSMSDRAQGIRLFNSESSLQQIFEEWEPEDTDSEGSIEGATTDKDADGKADTGVVTSQLRHFVAQPYILRPLLLPSTSNRKFHIRVYVLAVGALKVYVYKEMLALFADTSYVPPWEKKDDDEDEVTYLSRHLTNTCLQSDNTGHDAAPENVQRFWHLDDTGASMEPGWKERVYDQICAVTGEVFEAAARGMMVHFQTLPNAFEVFGVDYLVDETGNAWLLELNAFPDFRQTGDELKCEVVGKLFDEVVEIAVKPFLCPAGKGNAADDQVNSRFRLVADLDMGIK